jgi:hypothetical protein
MPAAASLFDTRDAPKLCDEDIQFFQTFVAKMLYLAKKLKPECLTAVTCKNTTWVKSKYAMKMSLLWVCASSIHRLGCVMALEQKRPDRKPYCFGLAILCAST